MKMLCTIFVFAFVYATHTVAGVKGRGPTVTSTASRDSNSHSETGWIYEWRRLGTFAPWLEKTEQKAVVYQLKVDTIHKSKGDKHIAGVRVDGMLNDSEGNELTVLPLGWRIGSLRRGNSWKTMRQYIYQFFIARQKTGPLTLKATGNSLVGAGFKSLSFSHMTPLLNKVSTAKLEPYQTDSTDFTISKKNDYPPMEKCLNAKCTTSFLPHKSYHLKHCSECNASYWWCDGTHICDKSDSSSGPAPNKSRTKRQ